MGFMTEQQLNNARVAAMMYAHYDELIHRRETAKDIIPLLKHEQQYWENEFHKNMPLDFLWQTTFS
jgi:hypothetical protein